MGEIESRPIRSIPEWLGWRFFDVTSTDVAALLGVHPWRTPLGVYNEKSRKLAVESTAQMDRGRWGEAGVFAMLEDICPDWQVRRAKIYLRDPEIRLAATPDGAAIDPERDGLGCIECKTVRKDIFQRYWVNGEPPLHYRLQAMTAAMLLDAQWIAIATLIMDSWGGWQPHIHTMERDAETEAQIRQAVGKFWQDFDAGIVPALTAGKDAPVISEMYPKPLTKQPLDLSQDNLLPGVLGERVSVKAGITQLQTRLTEIDTDIKAKIGIHESAILPGWEITWKAEHVKEHTVKAFDRRVLRVIEA